MRDFAFRTCLFAMFALATGAGAQIVSSPSAMQCIANASVPPLVRAEGLTELTGDLTLNCSGGVPTQANASVPRVNFQIFLNTAVTSRVLAGGNWSEALLLVDEPHSPANPLSPLLVCGDTGTDVSPGDPGSCSIAGTGTGTGVYSGARGRPNVFQGRIAGPNSIVWAGVPIDPPGPGSTRAVRFTNIRANAAQLGVSTTLAPVQIILYLSITGSTSTPVNNPVQTVAFVQPGLTVHAPEFRNYVQCKSPEGDRAVIPFRVDENFPTAFKKKNVAFRSPFATAYPTGGDQNQNVPGAIYNTETGFLNLNPAADPPLNPPDQSVIHTPVPASPGFPNLRGLPGAGAADHGTRIAISFTSIPDGVGVSTPSVISLVNRNTGAITGAAVLTPAGSSGEGPFSADFVALTVEGGRALATYEILYSDPYAPERLEVPITVSYGANPAFDFPKTGIESRVSASFAPFSAAPTPRFLPPPQPGYGLFVIGKCRCSLLFPFVTSRNGYDTGIVVANTSADNGTEFETAQESGTVTVHYFCGVPGCTSPPPQSAAVATEPGRQFAFTLSGGGPAGISAMPDFQGYVITQSTFRFCHGFAYLSATGASPTAGGTSIGYLGLVMDTGLNRTNIAANESLGH